jgi:hypothetical protein
LKIDIRLLAPVLILIFTAPLTIARGQDLAIPPSPTPQNSSLTNPGEPGPPSTEPAPAVHPIVPEQPSWRYTPPTETMKFHNYLFDAYGPYPLSWYVFVAGYDQARREPPDWREGFVGYAERYGSEYGMSAAGVTARYLTAEALHEDTLYYRCACKGVWSRFQHAVVSTLIARRGADGHKVFAIPALIDPYAGAFTAVYGWYPSRFGAKDAFRMGNYGLLEYAAGNVSIEFLPSLFPAKTSSLVSRFHLDNRHAAREGESAP